MAQKDPQQFIRLYSFDIADLMVTSGKNGLETIKAMEQTDAQTAKMWKDIAAGKGPTPTPTPTPPPPKLTLPVSHVEEAGAHNAPQAPGNPRGRN